MTPRFLKELKVELPFDLVITLMGIYPEEKRSLHRNDRGTCMFTVAQLAIAKIRNPSTMPII